MAELCISLLGPLQVTLGREAVAGFESNKPRALLAYLAIEAGRTHARETLAGLLWPDMPNDAALGNLRRVLSNLRQAIGDREAERPCLLITRDTVALDATASVVIDAARFAELVRGAGEASSACDRLEQAVALYRGDLLEGFSLADSAPFEEWLVVARERFRRQLLSALRRLAGRLEGLGDYGRARAYAWRLVELEPWDENAHRTLMRTLALSGRRAEALAHYAACCRLLERELGVAPSRETQALYERIREGSLTRPVSAAPGAPRASVVYPGASPDIRPRPVPLFVARREELARLEDLLRKVLDGDGQVVFVTGEPGSGKTMLVGEFLRRALAQQPDAIVAVGRCNAHTGLGDPYLPFLEILGTLTGDVEPLLAAGEIPREGADRLWGLLPVVVQALVEHGADLVDLLVPGAALSRRAELHTPQGAPWREALTGLLERHAAAGPRDLDQTAVFAQYARVLQAMARHAALVLFVDDLQWGDPGSISLLFHLGRRLAGSRILLLGAYRPGEVALGRDGGRHPLAPVVNELRSAYGDVEVDLSKADGRALVMELLERIPNHLGEAFVQTLYRHTDGHPLFTVELLRAFQEQGDLVRDEEGLWVEGAKVDWHALPARVEAVIAERVGRLSEEERSLLTAACIEGEEFTAEVVAQVQQRPTEEVLSALSRELGARHALVAASRADRVGSQHLSRYRFRHHLFWAYLDGRLDAVERSRLHGAVGSALEGLYRGEEGALDEAALHLARHYEGAGVIEKAVGYLHRAGDRAVRLFASEEALVHYRHALTLLERLPQTPERDRQELELQLALTSPLTTARGHAADEVQIASSRARELAVKIGDGPCLYAALMQLSIGHLVRAHLSEARQLAEQCLTLALRLEEPGLVAGAHFALGFYLGAFNELRSAVNHLEEGLTLYDPVAHRHLTRDFGFDPSVSSMIGMSRFLWRLGYPDRSTESMERGLARARELGHPNTTAMACCIAANVFHMRREPERALAAAQTARAVSVEHGIPHYRADSLMLQGWALAHLGRAEEGLALMHEGYASFPLEMRRVDKAQMQWWFADAYACAGDIERALEYMRAAEEEREAVGAPGGYITILQIKGDLLLRQGMEHAAGAEECFRQAIAHSVRIEAKSWELRATTSLCRLWAAQGRRQEARERLAAIYGWFTEGFATPDLVDARALLEELARAA